MVFLLIFSTKKICTKFLVKRNIKYYFVVISSFDQTEIKYAKLEKLIILPKDKFMLISYLINLKANIK